MVTKSITISSFLYVLFFACISHAAALTTCQLLGAWTHTPPSVLDVLLPVVILAVICGVVLGVKNSRLAVMATTILIGLLVVFIAVATSSKNTNWWMEARELLYYPLAVCLAGILTAEFKTRYVKLGS